MSPGQRTAPSSVTDTDSNMAGTFHASKTPRPAKCDRSTAPTSLLLKRSSRRNGDNGLASTIFIVSFYHAALAGAKSVLRYRLVDRYVTDDLFVLNELCGKGGWG